MPDNTRPERSCGECRACCIHLEIASQPGYSTLLQGAADVAKPGGHVCRFSTRQGCAVYRQRPQVCREFACDWLRGKGSGRPDRAGIIGVNGVNFHFAPRHLEG